MRYRRRAAGWRLAGVVQGRAGKGLQAAAPPQSPGPGGRKRGRACGVTPSLRQGFCGGRRGPPRRCPQRHTPSRRLRGGWRRDPAAARPCEGRGERPPRPSGRRKPAAARSRLPKRGGRQRPGRDGECSRRRALYQRPYFIWLGVKKFWKPSAACGFLTLLNPV